MPRLTPALSLLILITALSATACSTSQPSSSSPGEPLEQPSQETKREPAEETAKEGRDPRVVDLSIDDEAIWLGDENVLTLVDGKVPADRKMRGESGMKIIPLSERLAAVLERMKQDGLIGDPPKEVTLGMTTAALVSYDLVTEVMYTAGQAGIFHFRMSVMQADGSRTSFDIHSPKLEEPKNRAHLFVLVEANGFSLSAEGMFLAPIEGCPESGPTICLLDSDSNASSMVERARRAQDQGNTEQATRLLGKAVEAYDFRQLYNVLAEQKKKYVDETIIWFGGDEDTPMEIVGMVAQVVRHQLPEEQYDERATFRDVFDGFEGNDALFPQIVFTVEQRARFR